MKVKINTINPIPWREQLDLQQTEAMSDETGWLDDIFEEIDGGGLPVSPRIPVCS